MIFGASGVSLGGGGQLRVYGSAHAAKPDYMEFNRGSLVSGYFDGAGILTLNNTTDATTSSDGSLRLAGGLSVAKRAIIGGDTAVLGTITAKEIKVTSTGADYVFDDEYKLRSLVEVATYIKREKRLPDMPSASEMQKDGLHVSDVVTRQLAKIEELTLYAIALEQENQRLRNVQTAQAEKLKNHEEALRSIDARLENLENAKHKVNP
jgi:hypothetical protein